MSHGKKHSLNNTADHTPVTLSEFNAMITDETVASESYADAVVLTGGHFELSGDSTLTPTASGNSLALYNDLIIPKTSGKGIKVDPDSPSFGWRDIVGYPTLRGNASIDPVWTTYLGTMSQYIMGTTGKYLTFCFHIPHDYVPGTDLYIHVHWSHISSGVTGGAITWEFETMYAKGHQQAAFATPAAKLTVAQNAQTGAGGQYYHMVAEAQLTAPSPGTGQFNTNVVEVDGLVVARIRVSNNTVSDGSPVWPFFHTADLHYQSNNTATKQKAPNFYV